MNASQVMSAAVAAEMSSRLPPCPSLPQTAGYVTPYQGLTLVSVHGAGHHVSYFKPAQALQMISAWLDDRLP